MNNLQFSSWSQAELALNPIHRLTIGSLYYLVCLKRKISKRITLCLAYRSLKCYQVYKLFWSRWVILQNFDHLIFLIVSFVSLFLLSLFNYTFSNLFFLSFCVLFTIYILWLIPSIFFFPHFFSCFSCMFVLLTIVYT